MTRLVSVVFWSNRLVGPTMSAELKRVEPNFSELGDWIRVSPSQWFLWTDASRETLLAKLRALRVDPLNDQLIVTAVQPESAQGTAPQWIWDWLNDKMARQFQGKS